jgi:hypothetical protein
MMMLSQGVLMYFAEDTEDFSNNMITVECEQETVPMQNESDDQVSPVTVIIYCQIYYTSIVKGEF